MKGCGLGRSLEGLSAADRREIRTFVRFLHLKERHFAQMLQRPRWRQYLNCLPAADTYASDSSERARGLDEKQQLTDR